MDLMCFHLSHLCLEFCKGNRGADLLDHAVALVAQENLSKTLAQGAQKALAQQP